MQNNKWGRIINVTSVSVKEPLNYLLILLSVYKCGLRCFHSYKIGVPQFRKPISNLFKSVEKQTIIDKKKDKIKIDKRNKGSITEENS